jgi:hypothetical protein
MKTAMTIFTLVVCLCACIAMAQSVPPRPDAPGGHEPPPQAYKDCIGKNAGDTVLHTTPEGKVTATCVDSLKGLVARPNKPRSNQPNVQQRQSIP